VAGVDVGTAYLTIVPSAKGFAGKLQAELGGGMAAAGSKAGDSAGKSFGTRFKSGVATAAKAGALGLVAALGAGIAFAKGAVAEARESQKVGALTAQVIKSTGGAAKVTAGQVGDLATALSNKTGIDDETIQSGANMLLTFKNIRNEAGKGNDIFNQSTAVLTDMATAMGTEPKQAAIQLGKALNDPVKGITALSRVGVTFTDQQKKTIKSLVAGGKTAEAQKIILKELGSEFGGAAAASSTMGEKAGVAFGNLKEQIGTALLPYLDKAEKLLVEKVIPAVSDFFQGMQDGTGKGGAFVAFLKDAGDKLSAVAGFIKRNSDVLLPLVGAIMAGVAAFKIVTAVVRAYTAVQAALNVVLSLNPIGLVIIAVAALVAGIIIAYKKSETFRNIVKGAFDAIGSAARFMWNNVVAPVIRFLLNAFDKVTGYYSTLLRALSKVPGFGWAKTAADALDRAGGKARDMAAAIKDIPAHKSVTIDVSTRVMTGRIKVGGESVNVGMRASGGPVAAGRPYVVGEREPELFVPKTSGTIYNQAQLAGMGGGKTDLSDATMYRLAAILQGAPLQATVSPRSFDSAMAVGL